MPFNGKDAAGERVSLLNDDNYVQVAPHHFSSLTFRPRHGSLRSSPDTVFLTRQNSWGAGNESSSPLSATSTNGFHTSHHNSPSLPYQSAPRQQQLPFPQRDPPADYQYPPPPAPVTTPITAPYVYGQHPAYPSSTHSSPISPHHHHPPGHFPAPNHPSNADHAVRDGREAGGKVGGKRYPCRLAHEYGCDKTFTTSGHASRHSKIHTAEKMVACGVVGCERKFTRSDNMKQHMETHKKKRSSTHGVRKPAHARSARNQSRESSYSSTAMDLLAEIAVSHQGEGPRR